MLKLAGKTRQFPQMENVIVLRSAVTLAIYHAGPRNLIYVQYVYQCAITRLSLVIISDTRRAVH